VASASLEGGTALVTGAGGGIGGAIVAALARRGVAVGLVGRRRAPLARIAKSLGERPHFVCEADLASEPDVRATARSFLHRFGRLDVLVHSDGTHASAPLEHARVRDFDRLWSTNVRSPFLLTQLLLPALRASSGQIVFVNSSVGLQTRAGVGQFSATQHALRALAETLRTELNPEGIRVLNVFPGRTATDRQRKIFRGEGRPYEPERLLQPEEIATVIVDALALPRTAEVTDIKIRPMLKPL
jgi:NAD(P)-dependent dehydrogenase (short-subunit alcohol dehydrogenase family)